MKRISTLAFFICFSLGITLAQTKLISHKSHSGSISNFKIALDENLWDLSASDFGEAPRPDIHYSVLDSLVFVNDSVSIMWTSSYCSWWGDKDTTKWMPGGAYLHKHPLFSKQHALDSIKSVLDSTYNFRNKAESAVFVGYDNGQQISTKKIKQTPSKRAIRKAKKEARKEAKKKARKERKLKKKKLQEEKVNPDWQPVVKPALIAAAISDDPKDPPAPFGALKLILIGTAIFLGILTTFLYQRIPGLNRIEAKSV